jgi:hypothetical protein
MNQAFVQPEIINKYIYSNIGKLCLDISPPSIGMSLHDRQLILKKYLGLKLTGVMYVCTAILPAALSDTQSKEKQYRVYSNITSDMQRKQKKNSNDF